MRPRLLGRRLDASVELSLADRDRTITLLKGAWQVAACEYKRADQEGRAHLNALMETILDIVNTLGAL